MADIFKALGISEAGDILRQPEIDKIVAQIVEYKNPIRMNFPRKTGSGDKWYINRRTPGTTGAQWVSDTDSITEETGSYTQVTFAYKTLATKGRVSRKLQAQGASYASVLADEIEAQSLDFKDKEDYGLVWGNANNSNEFDGMDRLITSAQTVVMSSVSGGAVITLTKMDEVIDQCAFEPDMIICSKRTRRQLNAALQASQRFVNSIEVRGGFKVSSYNNIPVFVSTNIMNTQTFSGTVVSSNTGGACSTLYVIDTEHMWIGVLTPITVLELAKTTSQRDDFEIYCDETLVLRNPLSPAKLIGLSG